MFQKEITTFKKHNKLHCFFCNKNQPHTNSNIIKPVYFKTYWSSNGRKSVVHYKIDEISVPRCKVCENFHYSGRNLYYFNFVISTFIFATYLNNLGFKIGDIFLIIVVFCWILSKAINTIYFGRRKTLYNSEYKLKKFEPLNNKINNGWSFYKPQAATILELINLTFKLYDLIDEQITNFLEYVLLKKSSV